jgi:hypothetical protein
MLNREPTIGESEKFLAASHPRGFAANKKQYLEEWPSGFVLHLDFCVLE